ncbi:MAG: Flp family type IVb pilin [Micavibrio aeruginosavorus]|uniref:Flp family type IVb pilin n=1 Tax=Micavibrio aeruginosavorus TaxID=349221 RepID=A0A2W5MW69_9BACT|nr:MAG: Flp family type IVb pilin [Micavibrio aeruginosavorus]
MRRVFKNWCKDQSGATAIEYGLIVTAIALAIIVAVFAFGADLGAFYESLGDIFDGIA